VKRLPRRSRFQQLATPGVLLLIHGMPMHEDYDGEIQRCEAVMLAETQKGKRRAGARPHGGMESTCAETLGRFTDKWASA
jgi:hypothetical protein